LRRGRRYGQQAAQSEKKKRPEDRDSKNWRTFGGVQQGERDCKRGVLRLIPRFPTQGALKTWRSKNAVGFCGGVIRALGFNASPGDARDARLKMGWQREEVHVSGMSRSPARTGRYQAVSALFPLTPPSRGTAVEL